MHMPPGWKCSTGTLGVPVHDVLWNSGANSCSRQPFVTGTSSNSWYILPNTVFAFAAPIMIVNIKVPHGTRQALQISIPITVMVSLCCLSLTVSIPSSSCVWDTFFGEDGGVWWAKWVTLLILPVPALLVIWVVMVACHAGRAIDIGVIVLFMSSLRLLENLSVPAVLSSTSMGVLLSVRLYNHLYPKID
jgi:hypothetical protein